ncbi:MAG: hypothetical protein K5779_09260 [Saccharofermentans sp.]|nr:hypothetical protein [Saccharofermentans sp.]
MRKIIAVIMAGSILFAASACDAKTDQSNYSLVTEATETKAVYGFEDESSDNSSEYTVADEDKAQKVIRSPHNNLLGIEKIVLFENRATAVFDKKTNDKTTGFLKGGNAGIQYLWFSFNNLSPLETVYNVSEDEDKYILEASCGYQKSDLIDPDREVKIVDLFVKGMDDSIYIAIYGDDLELNLYKANYDTYTHYFDSAENKWNKVTADIYKPEDDSDTGISVSYSLGLENPWSGEVTDENSGIKYVIRNFGHYLDVEIENTTEETKIIGGTRYLQRVKDSMLIDLGRDGRELTLVDKKVKDMSKVLIWDITSDDPDMPYNLSEHPDIELNENGTASIGPGQRYYVQILVLDFDADKDGMYRMTLGDVTMDFKTRWDMIW